LIAAILFVRHISTTKSAGRYVAPRESNTSMAGARRRRRWRCSQMCGQLQTGALGIEGLSVGNAGGAEGQSYPIATAKMHRPRGLHGPSFARRPTYEALWGSGAEAGGRRRTNRNMFELPFPLVGVRTESPIKETAFHTQLPMVEPCKTRVPGMRYSVITVLPKNRKWHCSIGI
jgi:hypothetical protein